ncbi:MULTISPECIES: 3'-5' exoribonuclease domain-containing protein [unclassified Streptomyces]|uniref:3'-5' exoribonuclease domain-containing protein n=1 Tax=unclassified Streptomyces TaxID=2593676 RepID=UPI00278C4FD3|nr:MULTISPECIES: 3'-5' exoribonuclease [unclassified Streptomyces]
MTALDYDLEFLEDGRTIELISIGMVRDDGAEYYAVNRDMPVRKIRKHKWLMDNVVPHLPKGQGDRRNHVPQRWLFDYADPVVKRHDRIADDVMDFIRGAGSDVELWANYGAYDHVALAQLWGRMIDLPEGVPMFTNDIQQELRRLGFASDQLPAQEGAVHNALADARHNQTVRRWLAEQETRTP